VLLAGVAGTLLLAAEVEGAPDADDEGVAVVVVVEGVVAVVVVVLELVDAVLGVDVNDDGMVKAGVDVVVAEEPVVDEDVAAALVDAAGVADVNDGKLMLDGAVPVVTV